MSDDQVEPVERAGLDELRALQLARLKESVRLAYEHTRYYRAKCDAARVHPGELERLEDIVRFPFTTKDDLRRNYPFDSFAVPMDRIVRLHASSGTTGQATVVGYTRADIDTWSALMARAIRAAGIRPGDVVQVAYGYGLFTGGLGFHYGAERVGAAVVPLGGGATERQVQLIQDFKPALLAATPSYLLTIADEFERQGLDARAASPRVAMCGAEPWTDAMRDEIERRMGLDALNIYGLSEVMGPGVASEYLATKDGLTLFEDHFYPEVIDPETGAPLPDGSTGELVLTTLTKVGMPAIRFRTRDLTRLLPGTGRAMRRMERVTGRSDDMLIIRGINVFPSQIEAILLKDGNLAPHYVLEVRRPARLDELEVVVETRPVLGGRLDAARLEQLARATEHQLKAYIGVSATVRVVEPGTLARSQGKAKRVNDLRSRE